MSVATEEEKRAFLDDLAQISQKHNVWIWGCGCCGSPSLIKAKPGEYTGYGEGWMTEVEPQEAEKQDPMMEVPKP